MAKMIQFHDDALQSILKGVKTLAKVVSSTLGPKGRNVFIAKEGEAPISTKDGACVAKEIVLKNKYENMGASLVKEAASKSAEIAGDGTTTAIVLAEAILARGVKQIAAGSNPMDLKKGIDRAVKLLEKELHAMAKQVKSPEEIFQIASLAANLDHSIGTLITEALQKVGKDGLISLDEAKGFDTVLDVTEGMQWATGYLSPYFVTNPEKMTVEFENASVLIMDTKITSVKELLPILEKAIRSNRPLLIVAEDIDREALSMLVINKIKGGKALAAIKAPGFGDHQKALLQDLAILTGAKVVTSELGMRLEEAGEEILGTAKKITLSKEKAAFIGTAAQETDIENRKQEIKTALGQPNLSSYDKEKLEERLAKLSGGAAIIYVGALTEIEAKEKKMRIEDSLHATRAAIAQGILPGGGAALIYASKALETLCAAGDEAIGIQIMKEACLTPAAAIANNCGKNGALIAEKIKEQTGSFGYNGLTDDFSDLMQDGVIDPVLVTVSALVHAASTAGMLMTVAALVADKES